MRTLAALTSLLLVQTASAQCTHDPLIFPDEVILCPNEGIVLSTQTADAYQWHKDGVAIAGATEQYHQVNSASDAGSQFSVLATVDGCAELSPPVLVDGWLFLLPFVMHAGDEPAVITPEGAYYCPGDSVLLVLMPPYSINIQWTDGGLPIPGATDDTLVVTTSGSYNVSGAPEICPDFQQQLGVTIDVQFLQLMVPEIVVVDGDLCASPQPGTFLWFFNGELIGTGDCITPASAGSYTVSADYGGPCAPGVSEPYIILGLAETGTAAAIVAPNPASDLVRVRSERPLTGPWRLTDASGRWVKQGRFTGCTDCPIDLSGAEAGPYWLVTDSNTVLRVSVIR